jgi:hypothetical protein
MAEKKDTAATPVKPVGDKPDFMSDEEIAQLQAEGAANPAPAVNADGMDPLDLESMDFSKFHEELVGFAPYWKPIVTCLECGYQLGKDELRCRAHPHGRLQGNKFFATVLYSDYEEVMAKLPEGDDPEKAHVRWLLQAQANNHKCFSGSTIRNTDEEVIVNKGEAFTVSDTKGGLRLEKYIGLTVLVSPKRKVPVVSKPGNTVWTWSVKVDTETKEILEAQRLELMASEQKKMFLKMQEFKKLVAAKAAASATVQKSDARDIETISAADVGAVPAELLAPSQQASA